MDTSVAWLLPEQRGPASDLFSRLWASQEGPKPPLGGRQLRVPDLIDQHVPADYTAAAEAAPVPSSRRPPAPLPPQPNGAPRDRSCTVELDLHRNELVGRHGGTPWMVPGKQYSTGVNGLHEEIEDFYIYMSPSREEHAMREGVYAKIRRVILSLWETAGVFIFGSFETGLYLPTSDIDIVVMGSWEKSLEMLKEALIQADICEPSSIKVLDKAAVPIIKLTDRLTDVKVDISFNMKNGPLSAHTIKQYQEEYPQMPKLVIALKQFLLQRELNEVFTGGISSYSLILMTVGFLQDHERQMPPYAVRNLGVLLIEFFELYGIKFNYLKTCIKVKDRGYAPRSEVEEQFAAHSAHNSPLCIEDPHNATNDIGRSSYNMMKVKDAFKYAYQRLSSAVLSPGSAADPNKNSILGRVIQVTDRVVDYRRSIRERFPVAAPRPSPPRAPSSSPHSSTSPMSSGTSDTSDQDAESCEPGPAGRPSLTRDASPANSVSTAGTSSSSSSARSAPRAGTGGPVSNAGSGPGPGPGPGPSSGSGSGHGSSSGSGSGSGSGHGHNHSHSSGHGHGHGHGHGSGRGRRPHSGSSHHSSGGGSQQNSSRNRRSNNGTQHRRKPGGNSSSAQGDGGAVPSAGSGGGGGQRSSRGQPAHRAGPRDA